jgi:myo-inositol-1(or 4)-monophosphatase
VVYDPLRDELFTATRDGGASLWGTPLHVTTCRDLATALIGTGFAYVAGSRALQGRIVADVVGEVRDIRRAGSASLDLAWVAAGRLDGYFESVDMPWDWMAGALLVRELRPANPALPNIVASAPAIHDPLNRLLAKAVQKGQNSID